MAEFRHRGVIWYLDERGWIRCWCCLGTGDNNNGRECDACDGSGVRPDTPPCRPYCREPDRTLKLS